jgi:hypothetical protein
MDQATAALLGAVIGAIAPTIAAFINARNFRHQLEIQAKTNTEQLKHETTMQVERYQEERRTAVAVQVLESRLAAYADLLGWIEGTLKPKIPSGIEMVDSLTTAKELVRKTELGAEIYRRVLAYGSESVSELVSYLKRSMGLVSGMAMTDNREGATEQVGEIWKYMANIEAQIQKERRWVDWSLGEPG